MKRSIAENATISSVRNSLTLIAIGFVILVLGATIAFNRTFTQPEDTKKVTQDSNAMKTNLVLTSSVFEQNGKIPTPYTCDGTRDLHPPLSISGVPEGTKSLALIMYDPDVPKELKPDGIFDHWILFNIPPEITEIPEGGSFGIVGVNGRGEHAYTGPCPPKEYEPSEHRYFFSLYALDTELPLLATATKDEVLQAMEGHILGETELIGRYKRK